MIPTPIISVPTLLSWVHGKKRTLLLSSYCYLLIYHWWQCGCWPTCQLRPSLRQNSACILQCVCADCQWDTTKGRDCGGPDDGGISCRVSGIQSSHYDDCYLEFWQRKTGAKSLRWIDENYTGHWRTPCELIGGWDHVHRWSGKSYFFVTKLWYFKCLWVLTGSFAREYLVQEATTQEVLRVLSLTGSPLRDKLWVHHWLETGKMIVGSSMSALALYFVQLTLTGLMQSMLSHWSPVVLLWFSTGPKKS